MTTTSIERDKEKFEKLPEDLKEAIRMVDYDLLLNNVRIHHKLHIDQSESLEFLLSKLIFGEIESEEFVKKLEEKLEIATEESINIAKEINDTILIQIKNKLREIETE